MQRCPVESSNNARAFMLWRKREEFFFEAFSRGVVEQQNISLSPRVVVNSPTFFRVSREREKKSPR